MYALFLLVKDGIAFCSSATGAMDSPILSLIPKLDIHKDVDVELLSGTPMMPDKPAIMIGTEILHLIIAASFPH